MRDLKPQEVSDIYGVREELGGHGGTSPAAPGAECRTSSSWRPCSAEHSQAVDAGDLLAVFHSNVQFHRTLFELCGNTCLIETIEYLAQKVSGIRSYAYANPGALNDARQDHVAMIEALRHSRRDELITLTRRHLKPAEQAYVRAYRQRFGDGGAGA